MKTSLLIDHEPIADGGWFVRSALHLGCGAWAWGVTVTVRPGADAEYGQVAHSFVSTSVREVLVVDVGSLDVRAPTRVLVEFLVRADLEPGVDAQVAEIVVEGQVATDDGGTELQTITLPILLSPELGGRTEPTVRRERFRPLFS